MDNTHVCVNIDIYMYIYIETDIALTEESFGLAGIGLEGLGLQKLRAVESFSLWSSEFKALGALVFHFLDSRCVTLMLCP